jgi:hypothetical protein
MRRGPLTDVNAPAANHIENKPGSGVRILLGTASVHASGCHDAAQSFVTAIPRSDLLDRSYQGGLAGIEVRVTEANNGHEYKNFNFINDGKAITYQLYAKGAGNWVGKPRQSHSFNRGDELNGKQRSVRSKGGANRSG